MAQTVSVLLDVVDAERLAAIVSNRSRPLKRRSQQRYAEAASKACCAT